MNYMLYLEKLGMQRFKQFLIAVDQVFNVLIGSGWADETLSAYSWRIRSKRNWQYKLVDALFYKWHCLESYKSELDRQQLPPEYRK